tara:strand:- start:365 stop:676 length:312 start_codon:yes stop_codon:yes gene_type:complete
MLRNDLYRPWFADDKQWGFEILSGDFQGLVVQLENIDMLEEAKNGIGVNYHVIHKPEHLTKDVMQGEMLNQTFDLIINDILQEAMQINDEYNRDNNIKESDTQ